MNRRWSLHLVLVAVCAVAAGVLMLREPGFGDDFTYWSFAFDLHERGLRAWSQQSFHNLRWPVWGVCWLLQAAAGPGLFSYYGVPVLYLIAGALLSFTFGRLMTASPRVSWACAIAFLFHPLLDTVCYRPMPDLSEGVWGGLAMLAWWQVVHGRTGAACAGWAVLMGAAVYIAESNRLTGIFIAPVLAICTLLYARNRLGWLVFAGGIAAVLYVAEAAFYHHLFGDWLHNLHANLGGKGKKGTEAIPLLTLPFRFIDTLVDETRLSYFYAALALLGFGWAWRHPQARGHVSHEQTLAPPRPLGRVLVVWALSLYLTYACAPQSLWPWRPIVRDADRFLAGLAIPMSVLAALGLTWLLEITKARQARWGRWIFEQPVLAGSVGALLLVLISTRTLFNLGFVPEMRRYLRSLPEGTAVFTHTAMREFSYLVDPHTAAGFQWLTKGDIIEASPELEAMAAKASEFWYARKIVWLNTRKKLEQKELPQQAPLASYFEQPERDWALARLLAKGDTPDLVFYRRRTPAMPPPLVLSAEAPEWSNLLPALPLEWTPHDAARSPQVFWPVPANLRGKTVRLVLEAASEQVQAFVVSLRFYAGKSLHTEYLLKPYLYPQGGKEFFVLTLPASADQCAVQLKFAKGAHRVRFLSFSASFEKELAAPE